MEMPNDIINMEVCNKPEPPHPCDKAECDPFTEQEGQCPEPFICWEKLKNPAWPTEVTRCTPGEFMNVKKCTKVEPPHPCDPPPPCVPGKVVKKPCHFPQLCKERIKNIPPKKKDDCDDYHLPYPGVDRSPFPK